MLRNELKNFYNEMKRIKKYEVNFSEMSQKEKLSLFSNDDYFSKENIFNVLNNEVIVNNDTIAEALKKLPERKREIILLSYFLEMTDDEIGKNLNMVRSTVQYQRNQTLKELKRELEGLNEKIKKEKGERK